MVYQIIQNIIVQEEDIHDISAQSVDFIIIVHGEQLTISGISCLSPSVGGIFGLSNDLWINNGQKQLGFLNPFIYETATKDSTAFSDVTVGYNKGCSGFPTKGLPASTGWNAASRYGSPDYQKLKTYVLDAGQKNKQICIMCNICLYFVSSMLFCCHHYYHYRLIIYVMLDSQYYFSNFDKLQNFYAIQVIYYYW